MGDIQMFGFLTNLFSGIVGSVLATMFSDYIDYWLIYRKSDFTGYWKNSVFDSNNEVVKIDYCHLLHDKRKGTFKGTIVRAFPKKQSTRKWFCNGAIVKDKGIMSFWSAYESQKSDGSGYLLLTDDKKFEGIYMHSTNDNRIVSVNVMSEKLKDVDKIDQVKKLFRK